MKESGEAKSLESSVAKAPTDPGKSAPGAKAGESGGVRFSRAEIEALLMDMAGGGSAVRWVIFNDTFEPVSATVIP